MGVPFKIEKRRNRCSVINFRSWLRPRRGGVRRAESFPVSLRFLILKETPMAPLQTRCVKIRNRIYEPMY
jgi:hypothetical protein